TFTAQQKHPDPFNTIELDVTFTAPDGKAVRVPAFWAGGAVWRVRYSSPQVGTHTYRTRCSDPGDRGLHGLEGQVRVRPYRGTNEAGFPWERDYGRIRPGYFDRADERLFYLADQGLVPCVVGAWGYHLPWLGVGRMKKHWRYLVARYGALPVVWCVAGEINLP